MTENFSTHPYLTPSITIFKISPRRSLLSVSDTWGDANQAGQDLEENSDYTYDY